MTMDVNIEYSKEQFGYLKTCVIGWADTRGIIAISTPEKQLLKTMEELGETARAVLKGDRANIIDGIGDTVVTLIIVARLLNLDLTKCLETAWHEIEKREGLMVNGVFVKSETK